jgi:uncharacterized membrane protein
MMVMGLNILPDHEHKGLDSGPYWGLYGSVWLPLIWGFIILVFTVLGFVGTFCDNKCLTWTGLIGPFVCFLISIAAGVCMMVAKDHHDAWYNVDHDVNMAIKALYPDNAKAWHQKYGDSCPAEYSDASVSACARTVDEYAYTHWSTMGAIYMALSLVASLFILAAIIIYAIRPVKSKQQVQQEELDRAAKIHSWDAEERTSVGSSDKELIGTV